MTWEPRCCVTTAVLVLDAVTGQGPLLCVTRQLTPFKAPKVCFPCSRWARHMQALWPG